MEDEDEDAGVVELAWKAALDAHAVGEEDDEGAFATLDAALDSYASPPGPGPRLKRRNVSKELQLLSLQRYATAAREAGRLPSREETRELLRQSFLQFLRRGGAPDEPRLSPPEFLKLIRNRRREIHARARQPSAPAGPSRAKARARASPSPATAAKRKLQEENERIRELIEVIDKARAQTQPAQGPDGAGPRGPAPGQEATPAVDAEDAQGTVDAILRALAEAREVQRETAERVEAIQRTLLHLDGMDEPSSASV